MHDDPGDEHALELTSASPEPGATPENAAPREVGVPRRFGIGVAMIIMVMYAVLFSTLQALNFSPVPFVLVAAFFTVVGLGQMVLYGGNRPRAASIVAGAVFLPFCCVGCAFYFEPAFFPEAFMLALTIIPLVGALCGYLAGVLTAGVFFTMDRIARRQERARRTDEASHPCGF